MILIVDVGYSGAGGTAAGVLLRDWRDAKPAREIVVPIAHVEDYVPGEFYRRELPCIEAVLEQLDVALACIVIDGYVTLGSPPRDGLGQILWEKLNREIPVVGVAKTKYIGAPSETELLRGQSTRALFVTAAGMSIAEAKRHVLSMAGEHRLPVMLQHVDGLSRRSAQA
jgi:deoxyribonuclease V